MYVCVYIVCVYIILWPACLFSLCFVSSSELTPIPKRQFVAETSQESQAQPHHFTAKVRPNIQFLGFGLHL